MIAVPSIVMLLLVAILSAVGSAVLSKPWMKKTALALSAMEVALAIFLVVLVTHS